MGKLKLRIQEANVSSTQTLAEQTDPRRKGNKKVRYQELPKPNVLETSEVVSKNMPTDYVTMILTGTTGKTYKVMMPHSYADRVPKVWSWNEQRYLVADKISAGLPLSEIADLTGVHRGIIYAWLQHPEFKEHVDGLTMETGWANKRERIAGLNKLTRVLFKKVMNEIDSVKLSDKSIGAVLTAIQTIAKQLGQEKEEFVEQTKVEQNTSISGAVAVVGLSVDSMLASKTTEERAKLEEDFKLMGDDIIRSITGEKD